MKCAAIGLFASVLFVFATSARAAVVADLTYTFNGNFLAEQATTATLTPQTGTGAAPGSIVFGNTTVLGQSHSVWDFNGVDAGSSSAQVGLLFDPAGNVNTTTYSVELVFSFNRDTNPYSRVMNLDNSSDLGLYVEGRGLSYYNFAFGSGNQIDPNEFHEVVLTVDSVNNDVVGYLDGGFSFSFNNAAAAAINPANMVRFFLDNTTNGANQEYSSGQIALLQYFNSTLTADDARRLFDDPLPGGAPSAAPEPATLTVMLLLGAVWSCGYYLHKRRRISAA